MTEHEPLRWGIAATGGVAAAMCDALFNDPDGRHRRLDLDGGAMLDLGIYPVAFARFLAGDPIETKVIGTLGETGVDVPNHGLAHEAQHAMERIHGGHRESDVISLDTTVSTMELLDDIRAQLGVVYPEEL